MESEHTTEIPTLLVEKMDNQPSYGDDFGENATVAQKDAHEMRAKDAEPDYTIIMPEKENTEPSNTDRKSSLLQGDATAGEGKATTPIAEVAATAAEVADAAAELDREPTPLPPSIEDAGRTGERRMSHTPITEVAETAAEVADSAATIDKDGSSEKATVKSP